MTADGLERKNHPGKGRDGEYTERSGHAVKLYQHAVAGQLPGYGRVVQVALSRQERRG